MTKAQLEWKIMEGAKQQQLEERRWQQTQKALESLVQGRVLDGNAVHEWLMSWGTEYEHLKPIRNSSSKD